MAGLPADGFLTCPADGEPVARHPPLSDVRRDGGGSIGAAPDAFTSSRGDSAKLSSRLGVDEHETALDSTLPKRKEGNWVSALVGRCGTWPKEKVLFRDSEGRVTGLLRLKWSSSLAGTRTRRHGWGYEAYSGSGRKEGCCTGSGCVGVKSCGDRRSGETRFSSSGVASGDGEGRVTWK